MDVQNVKESWLKLAEKTRKMIIIILFLQQLRKFNVMSSGKTQYILSPQTL